MSTGGPVQESSIDGRIFSVAADSTPKLNHGGSENELEMNGNGTVRIISKTVPWMWSGLKLDIDHDRDDMGFLKKIAKSKKKVPCTLTYVDGVTVGATGTIVGALDEDPSSSTCELSLGGGGESEQQ